MKDSLDVSHKNAVTNLDILTLANYSMDLHKFHIYPRLNYAGLQILWNIKTDRKPPRSIAVLTRV